MEEWRDVAGYEGIYQISNLGNLKIISCRFRKKIGQLMKTRINRFGYVQIGLCKSRVKKQKTMHILVCEAFIGPRPTGYDINHKDFDKTNNRLENLEYVTRQENQKHCNARHLKAISGFQEWRTTKVTPDQVREIRNLKGKENSFTVAGKYGISFSAVCKIWRRELWGHLD